MLAGNITGIVTPAILPFSNGISGLFASAGGENGNAFVHYRRGTIDVSGTFSNGIFASGASVTVITDPGTTIAVTSVAGEPLKPGIAIDAFGTAAAGQALTATVASTIEMRGAAAPDPALRRNGFGIRAFSFLDAPILVDYIGPGITTQGGNGIGIAALSGGGGIAINSSGPITTTGSGAFGIFANNSNLSASFPSEFKATPVFNGVPIGTIEVNATTVTTTGEFSTGIVANGSGNVAVNVLPGGSVSGGWQAGLTGGSSLFNLPATGVILNSINGVATLTNDGSIGALSDRAVGGTAQIINNGTMTGFVELTGSNQLTNIGTFNLRHFADTTGDGTRDTLRVAVSNLGGLGSTFTNNGTLALLGAPGATTLDNTGQFLPPGSTGNAMALNGPVQGQILGTTTFINSGSINLQANPVPGDVLLISGGQTPGTNGGGVFVSNGGRLLVDTVLNEGDPNSRSDVLVLDLATVAAGPTRLSVANAGGLGALTLGNGILVVQAVPGGTTAPAAFALAGPVVAGPYDYFLFRGSRDASAPESWFLRSTIDCTLAPNDPACKVPEPGPGPTPPGPLKPNFRPETSLYAAIPALALLYGRTLLDTLHERVGEEEHLRSAEGNPRRRPTTTVPGAASSPSTAIATATISASSALAPGTTTILAPSRSVRMSTVGSRRTATVPTPASMVRSAEPTAM